MPRRVLLLLLCVLATVVRADTRIRSVVFGGASAVQFDGPPSSDAFVCTTQACTRANGTCFPVPLRAAGDVLRVVDARMHTLQWLAWGHPLGAWDLARSDARVRQRALAAVWGAQTAAWRGITWSIDHWTRALGDARECLRAGTFVRGAPQRALAHFEARARTRLQLRDWAPGPLACGVAQNEPADDAQDALWQFAAARARIDGSHCTATELRAQAHALMRCLRMATPDDAPADHALAWRLPFDAFARFRDATGVEPAAPAPQKRTDWMTQWRVALSDATPALFCQPVASPDAPDAVAFHSAALAFSVDDATRAAMSPANVTDADIARLSLPAHVTPCPPWFFV